MTIDVYELQGDCGNGMEMIGFDASGLEFIETDEGGLILSGDLSFTKDFNNPSKVNLQLRDIFLEWFDYRLFQWKVYSEKLERGTWMPGIFTRTVQNICSRLSNPMEPWYPVISKMSRQECPYKAGVSLRSVGRWWVSTIMIDLFLSIAKQHTEHFDDVNVGELGIALTPNFLGEWKLFVEVSTSRDGQQHSECTMVRFRVLEV